MNEPSITVLIPTYKRPQLVKRAVFSALTQTFSNIQVLVFDNASGDETGKVINEIATKDERVKYYCNDTNIGGYKNFLKALSHVDTPYFIFLCDDDFLMPDLCQEAIAVFEKFPDIGFFAGSCIATKQYKIRDTIYNSVSAFPNVIKEGYFLPPQGFFELIKNGYHHLLSAMVFSSRIWKNEIFFDPYVNAGDVFMEMKIAARYPVYYSEKICSCFNMHELSPSANDSYQTLYPSWFYAIDEILKIFGDRTEIKECARRKMKKNFRNFLFLKSFKNSILGNTKEQYEVVKILAEDFHSYFRSFILLVSLLFIKCFPMIRLLLPRFEQWYIKKKYLRNYTNVKAVKEMYESRLAELNSLCDRER